jgi:hypothetical protein
MSLICCGAGIEKDGNKGCPHGQSLCSCLSRAALGTIAGDRIIEVINKRVVNVKQDQYGRISSR